MEARKIILKRSRTPLLFAAWLQLAGASLILVSGGGLLLPPVNSFYLLLLPIEVLLFCSAAAILLRRPGSWWVALLVQPPLLAGEVGVALWMVHALRTYDSQADRHGADPLINTLTLCWALLLALCSLTALVYLLRPCTRESFGRPAVSP